MSGVGRVVGGSGLGLGFGLGATVVGRLVVITRVSLTPALDVRSWSCTQRGPVGSDGPMNLGEPTFRQGPQVVVGAGVGFAVVRGAEVVTTRVSLTPALDTRSWSCTQRGPVGSDGPMNLGEPTFRHGPHEVVGVGCGCGLGFGGVTGCDGDGVGAGVGVGVGSGVGVGAGVEGT